jgi:hypothetical protein
MNIAVLVQDKLMQGLHRLIGSSRAIQPVAVAVHSTLLSKGARTGLMSRQLPPMTGSHATAPKTTRPLRVLRVVDKGQTAGGAGRMVISGRMADVCAELDRLAACEAALH